MSSPLIFHELTLRNFKSFGNDLTVFDLNLNVLTLIIGRNMDVSVNGQIDSNGAGKTTLLDGISYCLYDKAITKIPKDDLINNTNKKNMEATLVFEKDGVFYRVARYRKSKDKVRSGNGIAIYKGDTLASVAYDVIDKNSDIAQAGGADAQIEEIIGLPFDIFSRIIAFTASHEPFLSLPSTSTTSKANQKDIIEELLVMTEVTEKAKVLNTQISEENKELKTLSTVEAELTKQKTKFEDQIAALKTRISDWDDRKIADVARIKNRIETLSEVDFSTQEKLIDAIDEIKASVDSCEQKIAINRVTIRSLNDTVTKSKSWEVNHQNDLNQLTSVVNNLEEIDFDEQIKFIELVDTLTSEIATLKVAAQTATRESAEAHSKSSKAADQIEHLQDNKCPFCLQQFADTKSKLDELQSVVDENYKVIAASDKISKKSLEEVSRLEAKKADYSAHMKFTRLDALHKEKSRRDAVIVELNKAVNAVNPYASENLEALGEELSALQKKNGKFEATVTQLETEIQAYGKKVQFKSKVELEKAKNEHSQLIKELVALELSVNPHLDSLEDMESVTFDQSNAIKIKALERSVAHKTFLHKLLIKPDSFIRKALLTERLIYLNERLRYYLDILGLPHRVEFTSELEAKISSFGNDLNHAGLSTGQKARVNIALSFAFRDVLQKRYGKVNFCMLDECLDTGLSNVGVANAVQMIKRVARENNLSMFVISHRDEIVSSFDNILEVELLNGFTTVI